MLIAKHIEAPAVHGRCDWRHHSIQSIIGESPSAHDADFRYMLRFSALRMIFYGCWCVEGVRWPLRPLRTTRILPRRGKYPGTRFANQSQRTDCRAAIGTEPRVCGKNRQVFPDSSYLGLEHASP